MNYRLAFCGAGGTGKTTLVNELSNSRVSFKHKVLKSASREVYEERNLTEAKCAAMSPQERWNLQFAIFTKKMIKDKENECFLADRTLLDHFAYCLAYCHEAMSVEDVNSTENLVKHHMTTYYDRVIFTPTGLWPVQDDKFRNANQAWQTLIDSIIRGYIHKWDLPIETLLIEGVQQRADHVYNVVLEDLKDE